MKMPRDQGFALLEVLVAMTIMALVGLMAWRGMDALILGREVIDRRANQDGVYSQLVHQFERDCQFILHAEVLGSNPLSAGAKNIWWMRKWHVDNRDAWMIVGYGITPAGLQRWISTPLLQRSATAVLWASVSRDPDLLSSSFRVSLTLPEVTRQTAFVKTALVTSINAISPSSPNPDSATVPGGTTPNAPLTLATSTSGQRGIVMKWWLRDASAPITRSCLMGDTL